jgi:hypothetical protein
LKPFSTRKRRCILAFAIGAFGLALGLSLAPPPVQAQPPARQAFQPTKFTQIKCDANGKPLALQKAIVRYVPAQANKGNEGLSVDLIGVIHIGDQKFYEQLNTVFKDYDVVLYEGVKGQPNNKLLAEAMKTLLDYQKPADQMDLVTQSKHINYTAANFVHADVSWDDWGKRIQKVDDWLTLSLSLTADIYNLAKASPGKLPGVAPKDPYQKKIQMAEFHANQGDKALGKTLYKLVIELRNDACMEILDRQIATGKKKIAIFYGSGHMLDFERRLLQDYGMQRQSVVWLNAWDLTPKAVNSPIVPKIAG